MFLLAILVTVLVTACLPLLTRQVARVFPKLRLHDAPSWLPAVAAFLFLVAWFLPDIHISSETTTFQQHFVGGGMYTACLYVYFQQLLGWRFSWPIALLFIFAWTSAFGVANELLEFILTKLKLARIGTGDTDWDLLANTLGSFIGYALLYISRVERLK